MLAAFLEKCLELEPAEEFLAYLAAGPIEDATRVADNECLLRLIDLAEQNSAVRRALGCVWYHMSWEAEERVDILQRMHSLGVHGQLGN